jgi:DNA-binding GntR family transcriptional regulator
VAQDSPKLSRGAQRPKRVPAYTKLADELRKQVRDQRYSDGGRLPIETELSAAYGVSRQTVRRAFQDLVSEGIVYRVPGRGTFATEDPSRYTRSFNSIEDLLRISLDTELEVVQPPTIRVDLAASGRLRLSTDQVVTVRFRRFHEDRPFCTTQASLPVEVGRQLFDVPELNEVGVRRQMTVLSVVQRVAGTELSGADQSITAVPAPPDVARDIEVADGQPVLRIDRVYFDAEEHLLELAVNYFNPDRYSYRVRIGATR